MVEVLEGGDYSQVPLQRDDLNCCTLLCEISFHLARWEELARDHLGLDEIDIGIIKQECHGFDFYVLAFEMLAKWLSSTGRAANLGTLIQGLRSVGYEMRLSSLSSFCSNSAVIPGSIEQRFMLKVARNLSLHWKFVARLLGMSEVDIGSISRSGEGLQGQAVLMLEKWRKHSPLPPDSAYLQLFRSVQCLSEHFLHKEYLKTALFILECGYQPSATDF